MKKFTKIVATIGPASDNADVLKKLHDSGMDVARLNFSHGNHDYFKKVVKNIRSVSEDIAIMLDTKGPEIRTGEVKDNQMVLLEGDLVELSNKKKICQDKTIVVNYSALNKVKDGNIILLDDGLIELKVQKVGKKIIARVQNGGILGSRKTVSIQGHSIEVPFLSIKDREDIMFAINENLSFVAASFVRTEEDVLQLRKFLNKYNSKIQIISKIEHWEAVKNIDAIINVSDAVMVARGDLGVEMPLEKVPEIQAKVITRCNELGKPVIVATQMLESMKENPRPTRAEVSDVASAILQGTDAIMLSGETTVGKYPVQAVKMFTKIAKEYDSEVTRIIVDETNGKPADSRDCIALYVTKAAYEASKKLKTKAILTPTESGFTARMVSRFRPKCPILAITPDVTILRQLKLCWGVIPMLATKMYHKLDDMVDNLVKLSHKQGYVNRDDMIVVTAGYRIAEQGTTNLLEIYYVSDVLDRLKGRR